MKLTLILFRQNIHRYTNYHWFRQGKKRVEQTDAKQLLESRGIEVVDAKEFIYGPKPIEEFRPQISGFHDPIYPLNRHHPDWKSTPCYKYMDHNVLVEGYKQALILTNTVQVSEELPENVSNLANQVTLSDEFVLKAQKRTLLSCLLDAHQFKLPKRKDPKRPAWNFPIDYGITQNLKNDLLCKNLLNLCRQYVNSKTQAQMTDAFFSAPFQIFNKLLQFEVTAELLVTSSEPLKMIADPSFTKDVPLPDIYPTHCTISLDEHHFYDLQSIFPLKENSRWPYVHTALLHYDSTVVKNLYEEPVTEDQIIGRSVMKAFSIAAQQARSIAGDDDLKEILEPVVVQVIHTDSKFFHFSVFQLNTLALDEDSAIKNMYWHSERIPLYDNCAYVEAKPVLEKFNPEVLKRMVAFLQRK